MSSHDMLHGEYNCESTLNLGDVVNAEQKGVAIDDTTFEHCADQIPTRWPNTKQNITTMRLFKPWGMTQPKFFHGDMRKAWAGLKTFAKASGARFLVGISVTCQRHNDEKEWAAGQEFIKYVGAEHIMGVAVGNEIDLQVGGSNRGCLHDLWHNGGYLKTFIERVAEFDGLLPQLKSLPVTAVLSMNSMDGKPFTKKVTNFLKGVYAKFGDRFAMSINVYAQFSGGLAQAGCHKAALIGSKFTMDEPAGFTPNVVKDLRDRMKMLGQSDGKLWLGEIGWATHAYCVLKCHEGCNSQATQQTYYTNFLKWDLSAADIKVDHVFYFTLRDSSVFGQTEAFGLISKCGSRHCKFQR
jgi:hypothetical protein